MMMRVENKTKKEVRVEVSIIYEPHIVKSMDSTYVEPHNPNAEKIRRIDVVIGEV